MTLKKRRVLLLILLLVVLLALAYFKLSNTKKPVVKRQSAITFVMQDLQHRFPKAKVSILLVKNMTNKRHEKYFLIKAAVSENITTPCPSLTFYYYNYPIQHFLPHPPVQVVHNCEFCFSKPCYVIYPESAVIACYKGGGAERQWMAHFVEQGAIPINITKSNNVWYVVWRSTKNSTMVKCGVNENDEVVVVQPIS